MLKELHCGSCGDTLKAEGSIYECPSCGRKYKEDSLAEQIKKIGDIFGEALAYQKEEQIANIRRNLYSAIHEQYIDSIKIVGYCRELKKLLPDDFQANFYETANSGNMQSLNKALDEIDTEKYETYISDIIEFMLKSLNSENLLAVNNLIERAYKQKDLIEYDKYTTKFAEEAKKVDECVYDVTIPRDVFVAYSSADMAKVSELVSVLEEEGLSCFVAMRNLQHGRGAVGNYEKHLQEAIDNCKTVVLVSSVMSRTRSDARKVELPYIRKRDIERAPAEYGNDYTRMPAKYKKPRVEYLVEGYKGMAAESFVKEFFAGNEYRYSPKEVAEAVFNIMSMPVEEEKKSETPIGNDDLRSLMEKMDQIKNAQQATSNTGSTNVNSLLIRAKQFFENNDIANAKTYYNRVLDEQPENAEAWWGLSLITTRFNERSTQENFDIAKYEALINDADYKRAAMYAGGDLKKKFADYKALYENALERRAKAEALRKAEEERKAKEEAERQAKEEADRKAEEEAQNKIIFDKYLTIQNGVLKRRENVNFEDASYPGDLIDVTIPSGVKSIGSFAFRGCNSIKSITIPSSVKRIESYAFDHCKDCYKIIKYEGDLASWCKIDFDNSSDICKKARLFIQQEELRNLVIPAKITEINTYAFQGCTSLKNITIGNDVTHIGDYAFHLCDFLESVTIGDSVTSIGNCAFCYCTWLKKVTIGKNVTEIGEKAFWLSSKFDSITIGNNVTSIGDDAFAGCSDLKNVTIPKRFVGFMKSGLKRIFGAEAIKTINFTFTD